LLHMTAFHNISLEGVEALRRRFPARADRGSAMGRAIQTRTVVQIPDVLEDPGFAFKSELTTMGSRSILAAPMLRDGEPIGAIGVGRPEPGPFPNTQIALLQTFADQAVIAIENVRLFNETKEALEQQTATSDILRVISSSPTDVQPVFDAIVASSVRLCAAKFGVVFRFDGDMLSFVAHHNLAPAALRAYQSMWPRRPEPTQLTGTAILERRVLHVHDVPSEPRYTVAASWRDVIPIRTCVVVPILHGGEPIGVIALYRDEVAPFSERQIDLVKTFADQAVIAIENVRLFTELQEKNEALTQAHAKVTESLEQQTATSEILRVIARSPTDVQPVFDAIAAAATTLCAAKDAGVYRFDGTLIHLAAHHNQTAKDLEALRQAFPRPPGRGSITARAILTRGVAHTPDISADPEFEVGALVDRGFRAVLCVPMLRDGQPIGAISVTRREPVPFTAAQIVLLETFARQAVIAIENVRLFTELRERTAQLGRSVDELTALAQVSQALSSTLDIETVLTTIVLRAIELSGADGGSV